MTQKNIIYEKEKIRTHPIMVRHNVFIVWKPQYNLGIPIIDEHHRGIVSIINSLHFGMLNNYIKGMLIPIINMMYDYTRIHFEIEENFLEMIDFPNAEGHHELHLELSDRLNQMGKSSMLEKNPYPFMGFLKQWWINHICCEDLIFRDHLLSRMKD